MNSDVNAPRRWSRGAASLVVSLFHSLDTGTSAAHAADDVWALLKQPGHVILLRHSNAPGSQTESNDMDFKDCSIQRNLDADGKAQAIRIGDEFRKHGIAKVQLITSQYCRAVDTAALTRLGPVSQSPALNLVYIADLVSKSEASRKSVELIKKIPPNQLTMLVTHVGNIQAIVGTNLESGEMVVVHLDKAGEVEADGKITVP
jgi:phosphohistidine phosphatase SixA